VRGLVAALLLAGCPSTGEPGPCDTALQGEPRIELGDLSGGVYTPLESGDSLMVHSGLDGGFHSDLAVRLWGSGADQTATAGLTFRVAFEGAWDEESIDDLRPVCHDIEEPALLHTGRLFYLGPGCGDDPCTAPDDTAPACVEHRACVEREEDGFPNTTWEELYSLTATFEVDVAHDGFDASTAVAPVPLTQGFQVSGGG
jgi:hypothetical protein